MMTTIQTMMMTMMTTQTMMTKDPKFRHEFKHQINKVEELALSHRLGKLFAHDKHAGPGGEYKISSLYFDNYSDKALREKLDCVNKREKFRLRYYNDDLSFIRLEKKAKINGLSYKNQARLTLDECLRIMDGDIGFLIEKEEVVFRDFYLKSRTQLLKPKAIVIYDREAFTYEPGNVRVTLDKNIRTSYGDIKAFFDPDSPQLKVGDGISILEVKYDEFLPEIVKMAVNTPTTRASAYSKYAVSRRYE